MNLNYALILETLCEEYVTY